SSRARARSGRMVLPPGPLYPASSPEMFMVGWKISVSSSSAGPPGSLYRAAPASTRCSAGSNPSASSFSRTRSASVGGRAPGAALCQHGARTAGSGHLVGVRPPNLLEVWAPQLLLPLDEEGDAHRHTAGCPQRVQRAEEGGQ